MRKARSAFFNHIFRDEQELYEILVAAADRNARIALELTMINRDVLSLSKLIIDSFGEMMSVYNAETRYYYRQIMYAILNRVTLEEKAVLERYAKLFRMFTEPRGNISPRFLQT
ncbi:MAG: hypothetical protein HQL73_04980 [Magnetococcales bacterium]|nr:hypothetical protein [Magnetococcales bacterium]